MFTSNAIIYGKEYGNGYCYFCEHCKNYVGTHKPNPSVALGLIANKEMRELKKKAHSLLDTKWNNRRERNRLYYKLSVEMGIVCDTCHFGYMNTSELKQAIDIIESWQLK